MDLALERGSVTLQACFVFFFPTKTNANKENDTAEGSKWNTKAAIKKAL